MRCVRCCPLMPPGGASFQLTPQRYLFRVGRGEYCLGVFDNGWQGTLLGGILVRNVLVQVRKCAGLQGAARIPGRAEQASCNPHASELVCLCACLKVLLLCCLHH